MRTLSAAGTRGCLVALLVAVPLVLAPAAAPTTVVIDSPMPPPKWAQLERQLLADNGPACREFFEKYYDARGYLQAFLRWGANDGPDDAFENFNRWPELHALGGDDEILRIYLTALEGMIRQYSEAKTTEVPAGRAGMYVKEFSVQSDWMHHGEGLQLFNRMALSVPGLPSYRDRARRFAAFYMGDDPEAPNYDRDRKLIRSMINGSGGPMLRQATALDWAGDPFDATGFVALHGESTYAQFLEHYREYTDVAGDHFLNLVATTLPTNAFLVTGDATYRRWIVDYMDAWLARMRQNGGIIPSFVDVDGTIGGRDKKWWGNAYGWGFSPINPVTGRREHRNRIPRALVGFSNALLVTGDQKYVDSWREMIGAVNKQARVVNGRTDTRRCLAPMAGTAGRPNRGTSARSRCGIGRCARPIALAWAQTRGSTFCPAETVAIPKRPFNATSRASLAGSQPSAPTRHRRPSASPTTCSTPTPPPPTHWCD